MATSEWLTAFDQASKALTTTLYSGAIPSKAERAASAKVFRNYINYFKAGGESAKAVVQSELQNSDTYRFVAAVKLFIECGDAESLRELSQNVAQFGYRIPQQDLRRLWIKSPPTTTFNELTQFVAYQQQSLIGAMLYRPTAAAYELFEEFYPSSNSYNDCLAIRAIAKWSDLSLLRRVLNMPVVDDAELTNWYMSDPRVEAAFYLGLNGDSSGVEFLKNMADNLNPMRAVNVCYHLGQLALPDAIEPTMRLLESDSEETVATAINVAGDLGLPVFIPALCNVAERKIASFGDETPAYDEAIRAIRDIVGKPLDDLEEDYAEPSSEPYAKFYGEGEFTEEFRNNAIAISRDALKSMKPMQRYDHGELLTLEHLASDLLSPHSGPSYRAAYNLRAITGEDYGFDPDDDLIANLPSIEAWQHRANNPEPLASGGWAFWGKPIPTPEMDTP